MKNIVEAIDWDTKSILKEIESLCHNHEVDGEVHTDLSSNSLASAIYIPFAYEENQRNAILGFFQTNGFVTIDQAKENGMSMKRCEKCILETYSEALVLGCCIINPDLIIPPLKVVVDSCIDTDSFVDLSFHLPSELTYFRDDVCTIMTIHILNDLDCDSNGCLVIDEHELIYFSQGMVGNISQKILPLLIEDYARENAENFADYIDERKNNETSKLSKSSSKSKGRSKKSSFNENVQNALSFQECILPLKIAVEGIMREYSDLLEIQDTYNDNVSEKPQWEPENKVTSYEGPLYIFCRKSLYNSSFEKACSAAVVAEIEKVQQTRRGVSITEGGLDAAKCRSIQASFDESFPSACYYLQMIFKFFVAITADADATDEEMESLKCFCMGQCAWFAKTITEHCLFKANYESEGIFSFGCDAKDPEDSSPHIDFMKIFSSKIFLSHLSENENPLEILEKMFPGNMGVELSRMWMLCGTNFYDCGEDEGEEGNFKQFISHIEEFCL